MQATAHGRLFAGLVRVQVEKVGRDSTQPNQITKEINLFNLPRQSTGFSRHRKKGLPSTGSVAFWKIVGVIFDRYGNVSER